MDSAIQDEDVLWQRAFADSAGLFDNNLFFDPLVLSVNTLTPNNAGQIPTPFNNSVAQPAAASPSPELDYVAPAAPAPLLRPCPPETGAPATWKQLKSATTPTVPTTLVGPGLPCSSSSGEPGPAVASMAPASTESTSEDLQDTAAQQRGGESCVRKRDRAKLLRQKMNDGMDSLHQALVEISTSGANPSAAAATGLIPTRGPRRAAVVACSSDLVRELTSACLALREENASLKERMAALERERSSWGYAEGDDAARSEVVGAKGVHSGDGKKREGIQGGGSNAGKVFGQLLSLGVFGFLGPQSLEEGMKVSRDWRDKCSWDCCWSTLCVSRWRLCPEQRHAEVWRGAKKEEVHGIVCPPAPPPPWRHVYSRLHRELHIPTGAFLNPAHLIVGKSVQQGVAIWVALSQRSNGRTGRSVRCPSSGEYRTQEVVELRAVVQRVDEGPAVAVYPNGFSVRQVARSLSSTASTTAALSTTTTTTTTTTAGAFPRLPPGDERFSPRLTLNNGAGAGSVGPASAFSHLQRFNGGRAGEAAVASTAAVPFPATPLALYEYAAVDFFVEAAGCPTEAEFLRLEACVDIKIGGLQGAERVLTVPLGQGNEFVTGAAAAVMRGVGAGGAVERPSKRRGGSSEALPGRESGRNWALLPGFF